MIRQLYFTAEKHDSFSSGLNRCLDSLNSNLTGNNLLGVVFFINVSSDAHYFTIRKEIRSALHLRKLRMPFNVQAQSSEAILSMEIWMDDTAEQSEYFELSGIRYTLTHSESGKSVWGMGLSSEKEHLPITDQIVFSFEAVLQILKKEGMTLADIVRQWNYVPGILEIQQEGDKQLQHYQVFNEIRQKYYSASTFPDGYPSATGIGTSFGNYTLDFFAIQCSDSVQKIGLSNPKQQDAYKYEQSFLVGDTLSGQLKKTPLFERAKILKRQEEVLIFISGTASIIGQETIGIGDVKLQTEITINNMQELVSRLDTPQKMHFTYLRAYIKDLHDFQAVRTICENRFSDVTISYLLADVCRENLLVEMEGAVLMHY